MQKLISNLQCKYITYKVKVDAANESLTIGCYGTIIVENVDSKNIFDIPISCNMEGNIGAQGIASIYPRTNNSFSIVVNGKYPGTYEVVIMVTNLLEFQ